MKKIIGLIAALVLIITLLPFQQAEAANLNQQYVVDVKTKLTVREKPSPKAKAVGYLKNGTSVFVYNTEPGGWSRIKYKGKARYIASSYLKVILNYSMDKYGEIGSNYDHGDTISIMVGQKIRLKRVDNLNRNEYYDRAMLSSGPADYINNGTHILGVKPGRSTLHLLPFSNWEDEYVINIDVYK